MARTAHLPTVRIRNERGFNHPLIYQKMVERPAVRIAPGAVVDIVDKEGEWIGRGFYNAAAPSALRILTTQQDEPIDEIFFADRIQRAVRLRRNVLGLDEVANVWRVVHAEGDGLSGLVIDRYDDLVIVEFYAAGMYAFREAIRAALLDAFRNAQVWWFADDNAQRQELFTANSPKPLPAARWVTEYGKRFRVAAGGKHKTGFFCDQRENRHRLADFVVGKRVLDLCCNSGGFAVYAAKAGAAAVQAVDLDEEAIAACERNARENEVVVQTTRADIFPWLRDAIAAGKTWDVVILDPAKLTRDRQEIIAALKKYLDMNKLAMQVTTRGGLLLSCSCTGLVDEASFLDMLRRAGFYAEREVQVLEVNGAGADHPWLANVPESRYLKAVLSRIG
jgi:23S rRNA (cytosine1962-C5)-methyltransferase